MTYFRLMHKRIVFTRVIQELHRLTIVEIIRAIIIEERASHEEDERERLMFHHQTKATTGDQTVVLGPHER